MGGKWYGEIGFAETVETRPGIWEEQITKHNYYGNVIRNTRRLQSANLNDNVNVSNEISILADPYAYQNFHSIRYLEFMGSKWKVTNIEVEYPRLTLSLGGVYNDNE